MRVCEKIENGEACGIPIDIDGRRKGRWGGGEGEGWCDGLREGGGEGSMQTTRTTHGGGRRGGQRRESGFRVCVGENGRDVVGGGGDRW